MTRYEIDRRQALRLLGAAGVSSVALGACRGSEGTGGTKPAATGGEPGTTGAPAASGPITADTFKGAAACSLTPEQTEGPYYIDVDKIRADIREDRQGTPLRLAARVMDVDGCTPVKDAVFEVWHCDAGGLYSGFEEASRGTGGPPGRGSAGADQTRYLRGAQVTNADGIAVLSTIYPGWYQGRTVHIHAKVQLTNSKALTTQLYFDDKVSDVVYAKLPYSDRQGRRTLNGDDDIYRRETTLTVSEEGDGYLGLITLGVSR
ncbi:MAG: protocatechuate dioxygenase [Actinomycetota bacterium]|nr:protocatechuate dioxygenase [Actinomycetota bacterium]